MDRFLSNYTNRIDAKGRVSIPAPYRAILSRDGLEGVFMTPAPQDEAIEAGGNALITKITALIENHAVFSEDLLDLSMALFGESETVRIDADGRVVLPESLIAHAGLGQQVVFVGLGDRFRLWKPETFTARRAQARLRLRDVLAGQRLSGDTRE